MSTILFMFCQTNPLDNVPLSQIQSVEAVGDKLLFNIIDEDGNRDKRRHAKTDFIMHQIRNWGIELLGEA